MVDCKADAISEKLPVEFDCGAIHQLITIAFCRPILGQSVFTSEVDKLSILAQPKSSGRLTWVVGTHPFGYNLFKCEFWQSLNLDTFSIQEISKILTF